MFNKVLPIEMLVQLPRPFVHRLRDIRMKQLEDANKQHMANIKLSGGGGTYPPQTNTTMDATAIDDFIDELT